MDNRLLKLFQISVTTFVAAMSTYTAAELSVTTTHQAENAVIKKGAINTGGSQWLGTGYVDLNEGGHVQWNVQAGSAGSYNIYFRTAAKKNGVAGKILLNGAVINNKLVFPNTGSWGDGWSLTKLTDVQLDAGTNTIRLKDNGIAQPSVDELVLELVQASSSSSASSSGGSIFAWSYVDADGMFCPGTSTAEVLLPDFNVEVGKWKGARVDYPSTTLGYGPITLETIEITYANGSNNDLPMRVYGNGEILAKQEAFPPTGGWSVWSTVKVLTDAPIILGKRQLSLAALTDKGGPVIGRVRYWYFTDCSSGCGGANQRGMGDNCPADPLPGTVVGPKRDPIAYFTALHPWPPSGGPTTREFNAKKSRDPEGEALSYAWDFGDGSTSSDVLLHHTYANEGTYIVKLTITAEDGREDTFAEIVKVQDNISPNKRPVAVVDVTPLSGDTPLTVTADASASTDPDGDPLTFFWVAQREGLGFPSIAQTFTGPIQSFVLTEPGTYRVKGLVTDGNGGAAYFARTVSVSGNPTGGGECKNNKDCKAIYNGNLQSGWKVSKCNTNSNICRCKKGGSKNRCADVSK